MALSKSQLHTKILLKMELTLLMSCHPLRIFWAKWLMIQSAWNQRFHDTVPTCILPEDNRCSKRVIGSCNSSSPVQHRGVPYIPIFLISPELLLTLTFNDYQKYPNRRKTKSWEENVWWFDRFQNFKYSLFNFFIF